MQCSLRLQLFQTRQFSITFLRTESLFHEHFQLTHKSWIKNAAISLFYMKNAQLTVTGNILFSAALEGSAG